MTDPTDAAAAADPIGGAAAILTAAADAIVSEFGWADGAATDLREIADALTDDPGAGDRRIATRILDAARAAVATTVPVGSDTDELLLVRREARMSGRVTIGHSRLPVTTILNYLRAGNSYETICRGYPSVTPAALRVLDALRTELDEEPISEASCPDPASASLGEQDRTIPAPDEAPQAADLVKDGGEHGEQDPDREVGRATVAEPHSETEIRRQILCQQIAASVIASEARTRGRAHELDVVLAEAGIDPDSLDDHGDGRDA